MGQMAGGGGGSAPPMTSGGGIGGGGWGGMMGGWNQMQGSDKARLFMDTLGGLGQGMQGQLVDIGDGYMMRVNNPAGGAYGAFRKTYGDIDSEKRAEKQRQKERLERMEDRIKIMEMQEAANDRRAIRDAGIRSSQTAAQELLRLNAEQRKQNRMEKEVLRKEAREDAKQAEARKLEQAEARRGLVGELAEVLPQVGGRLVSVDPSVPMEQLEAFTRAKQGELTQMETEAAQRRTDTLLEQGQSRIESAKAKLAASNDPQTKQIEARLDSLEGIIVGLEDRTPPVYLDPSKQARAVDLVLGGATVEQALQAVGVNGQASGAPSVDPAGGEVYNPADIINQF